MTPYTRAETQLRRVLNAIAAVAGIALLASLVGVFFGLAPGFFVEPPWVSNALAGLALLAFLAWLAAGDVRRFRLLAWVLAGGLVLGAVLFLVLLASPRGSDQLGVLLAAAIVSGVLALVAAGQLRQTKSIPPILPWRTDKPTTAAERVGQVVCGVFGVAALVFAVVLFALAFVGPDTAFFVQPLMIGGTTMKIGLLGVLGLLAAWRIRERVELITVLIASNAASLVISLVVLASVARFGSTVAVDVLGRPISTQQIMVGVPLLDLVVVVGFVLLQLAMRRALLDYLGYLWPTQFRTVEALAASLVETADSGVVPAYEVALRVDRYLSSFPSNRLILTSAAITGLELTPLLWLQPPLSLMSPFHRNRFINLRYKRNLAAKEGRAPLFDLLRMQIDAAMRIGMQGVYLGYYSDARTHQQIGYTPFSQREPILAASKPVRNYPKLKVVTPEDARRMGLDVIQSADVVVIGSGPAGSILAEQLLAQGRDVLMLEKGLYVDPDAFTEDEVTQIGRLYSDGALQVSQSYRFQILQANCVGGGSVVNNAVCFDTPERVLQTWNDPQLHNAGLEVGEFRQSQAWVKERLRIKSIRDSSVTRPWPDVLNPGDRIIADGIAKVGLRPGDEFDVVRANIADCLGCGYCNIGCKFGRKLSMLDEVLPRAQQAYGAERLRIFSEAEVVGLNGSGRKIAEIVVRLRDGRQLLVRNPKTVVVSAGTIASSWLLMRSGIGDGELPVGRHLCFNMGSPLHAYRPPDGDRHLDSFAGLQIAHYLELGDRPGFVYETWFNPPVAQAMAMPGWLDRHEKNMARYRDLAAVGVLVGTEVGTPNDPYVTPALILRGAPDVSYKPSDRDLSTLVDALITLGHIMFEGGAKTVMASARSYRQEATFHDPSELQRLKKIVRGDRDIVLGTGHPQGGNAMSLTRGQDKGVIGPDFKVYGYDNLYVCDGSVHPGPTTVNPQLTIMTLAHYAASRIR